MTVREAVKYPSKFKDQDALLMFECSHCGEAVEIGRVTAGIAVVFWAYNNFRGHGKGQHIDKLGRFDTVEGVKGGK